ncbi:MAG TPA: fibronectin type III domain-containing protein [Dermatophilaceae bacterium]|nr:fibronectin type III domain-containing protein [Dermatophilaceae bacterium]
MWRITHNGVDTHPIHFHLYDVQVINRITWDNIVIPNDPNENGWKDTVRTSPLEDTIVALRPVIPKVPFEVPNSVRPLNPMMPIGSTDGFFNVDVNGNPTASVINSWVNFGWEYVYHCHILSHEEMDMMRPVSLALPPRAPDQLMRGQDATGPTLTWSDNSITETSFDVMRSTDGGVTWAKVGGLTSPLDPATPNEHGMRTVSVTIPAGSPDVNGTTRYKVVAHNLVGYGGDFPSMDAKSESQPLIVGAPLTPTNLAASLGTPEPVAGKRAVTLTWTPDPNPAMGMQTFAVQRSATPDFAAPVTIGTGISMSAATAGFTDPTLQPQSTTVYYRVMATIGGGLDSQWSPGLQVDLPDLTPATPVAPTLALGAVNAPAPTQNVDASWTANTTYAGAAYTLQRASDPGFTANVGIVGTATDAGAAMTLTDAARPESTTWYYRLQATQFGKTSAWGPAASQAIPTLSPAAPTGLAVTLGTPEPVAGARDVTLTWDAATGVTWEVERSLDPAFPAAGTTSIGTGLASPTVLDAAQPQATTVHYRVRAVSGAGVTSAWATITAALPNLTPVAPTVTITGGPPQQPIGGQDVTVTWSQVSPATYVVSRSLDPGMANPTTVTITDPNTGAMRAIDPLVPPGTTVYYVVTVTQYGLSASSAPQAFTTSTITVPAPTGLQVQVGPVNDPNPTFDVTLTWVEAAGTTYRVERSLDPTFATGTTTLTSTGAGSGTMQAVDAAVPHATTVYYRVIATQFGVDSSPALDSATTPNLTPAQPAVTAGLVNPHQVGLWDVSLTWTPDPLLTYVLERTSDPTQQTGWTTVPFTTPGAATDANQSAGGQTLWYRLTAYRLGVPSIPGSTSVTLTPLNPAPPQNVQLAWGNPAAPGVGEVTVTWTAVTGESYAVQHSLDGATWQAVGGSVPAGPLVDTGVPHATTVFYRVTATAYGLTATTQASITTPNLTPAAPSITSVTAGNPHATGLYDVTVSWSATGTTYDVYRTVGTGVAQQIATGTSATSVVDLDQAMLTTVTYEVVAHAYGLASAPSAPASLALPDLTPGAPADIQFAPSNPAGPPAQVDVSVSWTTVAGMTYTVEHSLDGGATWQQVSTPVSAGPVSDTGVPHASTVLYRVTAAAYGMSTSATASFSTPDITPAVPTGVTAAVGVSTPPVPTFPVTVSWSGPTGATFTVERSLNGGAFSEVAAGVTSPWTDPAVPHQSTVAYRVSSQQYGLTSVLSAAGTASTPSLTPATPVVTLSPSGAWPLTVTVSWPAVPGAVSYAVQRTDPAGTVVSLGSGAATTIVDSNAEFGTAYTYAVTVTNDYALSSTGSSSLTTPAGTLIAPDPVALNVLATGTSPGLVVTWTGGQPWARGYRVEISRDATFATGVIAQTATVPATSVTFTGLTRNATYYVRVQATRPNVTNPGPVIGPWTTSTSQRVSAPPMPRPTATAQTGGIIVLRWATAPQFPVGTYQIQIRRSTGGWANVSQSMINMTTNTATITGLTPGATYRFQMRAQNSAGWSSWSDVLTVRAR